MDQLTEQLVMIALIIFVRQTIGGEYYRLLGSVDQERCKSRVLYLGYTV